MTFVCIFSYIKLINICILSYQKHIQELSKFGSVSEETIAAFVKMFEEDLTPAAAWRGHRDKITEDNLQTIFF